LLSIQPLLVGGNPFISTSIYEQSIILSAEATYTFAMGGTAAITAAAQRLMERRH
jgi:phytoene desaturase